MGCTPRLHAQKVRSHRQTERILPIYGMLMYDLAKISCGGVDKADCSNISRSAKISNYMIYFPKFDL